MSTEPTWGTIKETLGAYCDGSAQAEELIHKSNGVRFEACRDDRVYYIAAVQKFGDRERRVVRAITMIELKYSRFNYLALLIRSVRNELRSNTHENLIHEPTRL